MQTNLTIELQEVKESIGVSEIALQGVKNPTETVLESKLAMMKCQRGENGYKLVANNCYFFDKGRRNKAEAIVNCASKFPSGGRFVEPRSDQVFELILKESYEYFPNGYVWLGVEYSSEKDAFIYSSDGAPVVTTKWYENSATAQPFDNGYQKRSENYYSYFGLYHTYWFNNFNEENNAFSICEPK